MLDDQLILTRHGHVEGITPARFRGREDVPLSKLGVIQASATAKRIAEAWRPAAVYTSAMSRCVETASAIAKASGIKSEILQSLNDLDYGDWQWKTHEEVNTATPKLYHRWIDAPHLFRFPNGESLQDLIARAGDAVRFLLQSHQHHSAVFVAHDSVNRAIAMLILDQPLSAYWRIIFDPCSISEFDFENATPRVRRLNENVHLEGLGES